MDNQQSKSNQVASRTHDPAGRFPWSYDEPEDERTLFWLEQVAACAKAEVLAQGYRSTDMANALKGLYGEFWFETEVGEDLAVPRCAWAVTTEMDDGPLVQRCTRRPHGPEVEHWFGLSGLAPEPGDKA